MITGGADRGHLEQIKQIEAEAEQIEAEAEQIVATSSRSEPRWSPAKPGEPILVRDDHRRSLVIEVGTGGSWRCRNPRQRTRKP